MNHHNLIILHHLWGPHFLFLTVLSIYAFIADNNAYKLSLSFLRQFKSFNRITWFQIIKYIFYYTFYFFFK